MKEEKKGKSLTDTVYDFFSSVTLSILVLIGLAITSIIGTVLQQGKEPEFYLQNYPSTGKIIQMFNLGDMYHSWWFQVLLALLLINITFCSIKRLPHAIKQMKDRDPLFEGRPVALHERRELSVKGDVAGVAEKLSALLGKKLGAVAREEKDGSVYLMASKGSFSRMGVYVTHSSLFLFALGALIGSQWGFKGAVNIVEGRSVTEVYDRSTDQMTPIGFEIRCDEFKLEHYPDGRPRDYLSKLTVLENGVEVVKKQIEVNDPLIHRGYYFYQSSYEPVGLKSIKATVAGPDRRIMISSALLSPEVTSIRLSDGNELVLADLWKDNRDRGAPMGVILGIARDGNLMDRGVAFAADPRQAWWPVGSYQVRLDEVNWRYYTGLQVARDPGVPVVWAGCILITIGLLISFFMSHRRVWVKVASKAGGQVTVQAVGNASRNRIAFERWFEEFDQEMREGFEK